MKFKRRRQGRTDYRRRLALLKSGKTRLVARKTLNNIIVQIVSYDPKGDKISITVDMASLKKHGWAAGANTPAGYLIGFLLGKRAKKFKLGELVFDIGRHRATKGSKLFAVLKGAVDAGLKLPHDDAMFPSQDRISGKHIASYEAPEPVFKAYKSRKLDPKKIDAHFEKVLNSIKGEK
ncbi:MAG: 50S ribosomal protein L18 [Candidatus Altiarchaeota archaeon]|nr:50S ribosomal protein L18 [Candidatus Altiarchaeota archaeon]